MMRREWTRGVIQWQTDGEWIGQQSVPGVALSPLRPPTPNQAQEAPMTGANAIVSRRACRGEGG